MRKFPSTPGESQSALPPERSPVNKRRVSTVARIARPDRQWLRASAFDRLSGSATILDGDGVILDTNQAWRLFSHLNDGNAAATDIGVNYLTVCDAAAATGADSAAAVGSALREILSGDRVRFDIEYPCASPTEDRWFLLQASALAAVNGSGLLVAHTDITAQRLIAERMAEARGIDPLTGLADNESIAHFVEEHLLANVDDAAAVCVVMLVVREAAGVREHYGPRVAEELLVKVAMRARRLMRSPDRLSRSGDDALIVACPILSERGAGALALRLRSAMTSSPFQIGDLEINGCVSVGCATSDRRSTSHTLFAEARRQAELDPGPQSFAPSGHTARHHSSFSTVGDNSELVARLAAVRAQADAASANSTDLVLFFQPDGTIQSATAACRQLFGGAPEDLIGRNGMDLVHPDDRERLFLDFATIAHFGDHVRSEFRVLDDDDAVRWMEQITTNVIDDPNVGCIVGNLREITEHKRSEEAVLMQARLLAAVGKAVVATDTDGIVTYWNAAAEETYGWTAPEAIGQQISGILRPVSGWEAVTEQIRPQLKSGQAWSGELWVQTKTGASIPVQLTDTVVYDDAQVAIGTIGVSSNIALRLRRQASTALLSSIVEASPDAIFSASTTGEVLSWNNGAATLFGRTSVDTIGQPLSTVLPNGRADDVRHVFASALAGQTIENFDTRGRRADGSDIHLSISVSPIKSPNGTIIGSSAIAHDITERIAFVHRIKADRRRLATAQSSAKLGSFEIDTVTGVITRSDEHWRLLGVEPDVGQGARFDLIHSDDRAQVRLLIESVVAGGPPIAGEYRIVRLDGTTLWVYAQAARLDAPDAHIVAGTMLDVTERHAAKVALEYQATHDWLTDLPNPAGFDRALALQMSNSNGGLALAIVDLDHFKLINDHAGHIIGDQALRAVADRLREFLPSTDVLARSGGDEFIIMRPNVRNILGAEKLARDIMALLVQPVETADRFILLTASVGVTLSGDDDSAESLKRDADDAMYEAKHRGRNCSVVLDTQSRAAAHRRQAVARELPGALQRREFQLEYQPVIDLSTGLVAGFEALIRWTHPTMGDIAPDEFISVAEHTGLIVQIGSWVLETAVGQLALWRAHTQVPNDLWMAFNVSALQLSQPHFVDQVAAVVLAAQVPADSVHLEITESILMDRIDDALRVVGDVQMRGLHVSIDDFGTGYSSLAYLSRLRVNAIKIDRSFVSGASASGHGTSIIRAMMTLARALDLDVVAEGVESEDQLALLTALGCTFGQGFLWSQSLLPDAAVEWIFRSLPSLPSATTDVGMLEPIVTIV